MPTFDSDKFHQVLDIKHETQELKDASYEDSLIVRIITDAYQADTTRVALMNSRHWLNDYKKHVSGAVEAQCKMRFRLKLLRLFGVE